MVVWYLNSSQHFDKVTLKWSYASFPYQCVRPATDWRFISAEIGIGLTWGRCFSILPGQENMASLTPETVNKRHPTILFINSTLNQVRGDPL